MISARYDGIDQQVADWRSSSTDPSLAPGVVADLGSWLLRSNGAIEGEIFEKLAAANTAWGRNNLTLQVFNVKNFGAVGNGVTDDRAAINTAIAAAKAAGAGIVYFPPGTYAVTKPGGGGAGATQSFLVELCSDITFLGDGQASLIKMTGSASFGDWRCFTVRNFATRIHFHNLAFDASTVTNPDPAEQLHFIQFQGLGGQPANSGAKDCEVIGCWFGYTVGDAVRTGADAADKQVQDIRVAWNVFDMSFFDGVTTLVARSGVGMQRLSNEMNIAYNFLTGIGDQEIDYEPTGAGGNRSDVIIGNICSHSGQSTASITIGGAGAATPILYTLASYNIIHRGGYILPSSTNGLMFSGNIIESEDTINPGLYVRSLTANIVFQGNVIYTTPIAASKSPVLVTSDADGSPQQLQFSDNILRSAFGDSCIGSEGGNRILFAGNVCRMTADIAGTAVTVAFRADATNSLDQILCIGNVAVNDSAALAAYRFATASTGCKNSAFCGNIGVNPGSSGFRWERATTELFTGFRYCGDNTMIGGSATSFDLPVTNVGGTFAGSAGLGVGQLGVSVAAGPEGSVSAPPGSMCTNYLGGNAKTLFWKETGTASSGWFGLGGWDFVWGAADTVAATLTALFLAPGDSLAVADATEFKIALPRNCRIRNLRIVQTAGTGAGTITYTIRINGADTGVAATINFTASSGSNLSTSRACLAGDLISVKITKSQAAATAPTNARLVLEII